MLNPLLIYITWKRRKEEEEQEYRDQGCYEGGCEGEGEGVADKWNPLWFLR